MLNTYVDNIDPGCRDATSERRLSVIQTAAAASLTKVGSGPFIISDANGVKSTFAASAL